MAAGYRRKDTTRLGVLVLRGTGTCTSGARAHPGVQQRDATTDLQGLRSRRRNCRSVTTPGRPWYRPSAGARRDLAVSDRYRARAPEVLLRGRPLDSGASPPRVLPVARRRSSSPPPDRGSRPPRRGRSSRQLLRDPYLEGFTHTGGPPNLRLCGPGHVRTR